MSLPALFREAKRLGYFIENIAELPRYSWLYVPASDSNISLDTLCLPTATDSREMAEEECEMFEENAAGAGLKCFLNRGQIEDVIANLQAQRPNLKADDAVLAVNYYCKNDAFILIPTAG